MRSKILAIVVGLVQFLSIAIRASELERKSIEINQVEVIIEFQNHYQFNRDVKIGVIIKNNSSQNLRILKSDGLGGVKVNLFGPDKKIIRGYHELMDSGIQSGMLKRRFYKEIEPGISVSLDTLDLSSMWPIESKGIYKCQLAVLVDSEKSFPGTQKWVPLEISVPEFEFGVSEVDSGFISPGKAAYLASKAKNIQLKKVERSADFSFWPLFVGAILMLLVVILLLRKSRLSNNSKISKY